MHVSSSFDSGNIRLIDCSEATNIRLEINRDRESGFMQWFYFRLTGAAQRQCLIRIVNAGDTRYPPGWEGYRAVASYDREFWFRVDTFYEDGELCIPAPTRLQRDLLRLLRALPAGEARHAGIRGANIAPGRAEARRNDPAGPGYRRHTDRRGNG